MANLEDLIAKIKKKKNKSHSVNHFNVNASIDLEKFINYNPLNDLNENQKEVVNNKSHPLKPNNTKKGLEDIIRKSVPESDISNNNNFDIKQSTGLKSKLRKTNYIPPDQRPWDDDFIKSNNNEELIKELKAEIESMRKRIENLEAISINGQISPNK